MKEIWCQFSYPVWHTQEEANKASFSQNYRGRAELIFKVLACLWVRNELICVLSQSAKRIVAQLCIGLETPKPRFRSRMSEDFTETTKCLEGKDYEQRNIVKYAQKEKG